MYKRKAWPQIDTWMDGPFLLRGAKAEYESLNPGGWYFWWWEDKDFFSDSCFLSGKKNGIIG